jgi:uncharacterized protein (DUF1330 family)
MVAAIERKRANPENVMAAYVIALVHVSDPSWIAEYGPPTRALVEKHGGRFLARDRNSTKVEGGGDAPSSAVIIEFPTLAQAKAFHSDPGYQPLIALRQSGSTGELLIVDGEG